MADPFSLSPEDYVPVEQPDDGSSARLMAALGNTWPAQMVKAALSAAALPGDVYSGATQMAAPGLRREDVTDVPGSMSPADPVIGRAADLAGMVMGGTFVGAPAGAVGAGPVRPGIRAYHGSPHDFDKFDLTKIGTGEGAQSYGHGLYFAEKEGTAKSYRDSLSSQSVKYPDGRTITPNWDDPGYNAIHTLHKTDGNYDSAISEASKIKQPDWRAAVVQQIEQYRKDGASLGQKGRMYEVNINAKPEQFLDWDKPLASQNDATRTAFNDWAKPFVSTRKVGPELTDVNIGGGAIGSFNPSKVDDVIADISKHVPTRGNDFYRMIGGDTYTHGNPVDSSAFLKDRGIPGIKYLDQGSRPDFKRVSELRAEAEKYAAKGQHEYAAESTKLADAIEGSGSRNYVVFDPIIVDIMRKYALPGAAIGGAGFGSLAPDDL